MKIEDTTLRGVRDNGQSDFDASLQILFLTYRTLNAQPRTENFSHLMLNYKMCDLRLQNSRDKLLFLNNLAFDAKVENDIVNLYGKLNTLLLTYDHDMIYNWLKMNFRPQKPAPVGGGAKENPVLARFLTRYVLNGCAEFCQVSALTRLSQRASSFGFAHMKLILEQAKERRGAEYEAHLPRLLLADRHWQTEILIESVFWSFGESEQPEAVSKRTHMWRTPLRLGMALVKFGTMENVETKVESLLDTLQVEWSRELGEYVLLGVKCLRQYGLDEKGGVNTKASPRGVAVCVNVALTHFNCFFQGDNGVSRSALCFSF